LVLQSWFAILQEYHYNTWAWISVGLAVGFLLFYWILFSQVTVSKNFLFWDVCVFILFSSVCSLHFFEKSYFDERPYYFFAEKSMLKARPRNGDKPIFTHEGTKVFVFETIGRWKKTTLTDGTEGWIDSSAIEGSKK
jgi:hypothetical protein